MAESDIQRYLNGIESQHSAKPRFMQHLTEILEKIDGATGAAKDMPIAFFIEEAVGNQLDILGKLIGITRIITIPGSDYYGVTVDDLVRWNKISNPRLILVGQKLKIYIR